MITKNDNPAAGTEAVTADQKLKIEYFTDPLCCWSWAFEPQWRRLRYEYARNITWKYVMGGMLMDWQSYNDPVYAISRPVQMGPVWKEAGYLSGMPLNDKLWIENPPSSSFPACMAVKTAELQGKEAAEHFMRAVREAAMVNAKDISSKTVLLAIAETMAEDFPGTLDYDRFAKELSSGAALDDLKSDFQKVKVRGVSRYPSLVVTATGGMAILITGYKPYQVIESALQRLLPDIEAKGTIDINDYKRQWRHLTDREVAEVQGGGV